MEGGGFFVIASVAMIFIVLAVNVWPLFQKVEVAVQQSYPVPGSGSSLHYIMDEYGEVGARLTASGEVIFFSLEDGYVWERHQLPGTDTAKVVSYAATRPHNGGMVLGLEDGRFVYAAVDFESSFDGNKQSNTPVITWPLGERALLLDERGAALQRIAVRVLDDGFAVVAMAADGRILIGNYQIEENEFSGEVELSSRLVDIGWIESEPERLMLSYDANTLYAIGGDTIDLYDLASAKRVTLIQRVRTPSAQRIDSASWVAGEDSLLLGLSDGSVTQWIPVNIGHGVHELRMARTFEAHEDKANAIALAVEYNRRSFVMVSATGGISLHHTTSERDLWQGIGYKPALNPVFSPRGEKLLLESGGSLHLYKVDNPHPEYSLQAVWDKVWYEGRSEPEHVWQSSSASEDFESKFSLTPLLFGTLKASWYTMLFSIPFAILAACYSACFMAPRLRQVVKPSIEILAAIPTVILGFLAGLWLAPLVEQYLSAVFIAVVIAPVLVVSLAFVWKRFCSSGMHKAIAGWEPVLLLPLLLLAAALSVWLGDVLDMAWLDIQLSRWLVDHGISYSQRNSMVVGIAMGVAVIPIIYSISEDAMYEVPRHLINSSLALGASRWQTMWRIVLLTASPALFSAIMIGLGRAVGETMIVVMATGNTPVMDFSIFQGFRAISANVAVEVPEAEKNSTHFRILFLATMLLFAITFVLNTVAEVVRQRLRRRYSNL